MTAPPLAVFVSRDYGLEHRQRLAESERSLTDTGVALRLCAEGVSILVTGNSRSLHVEDHSSAAAHASVTCPCTPTRVLAYSRVDLDIARRGALEDARLLALKTICSLQLAR